MKLFTIFLSLVLSHTLSAQILSIDFDRPDSGILPERSQYQHQINHYGDLEYIDDRFGNGCRAANFTGSQFLEIPHSDVFNVSEQFTAMAWLKLPDRRDFQWITLICKGLHQIETEDSPAFRVQMTSQTVSVNTSSTKEIDEVFQNYPRQQWFHFATTFDDGKITIYVNGEVYKSFYTATVLGENKHSVTVGYDIPGDEEYFTGAMDDLYFFDYTMSEKEILAYATDMTNQNAGGICPVSPPQQKIPQKFASKDPWSNITIDEIDDDPVDNSTVVTVPDNNVPNQPNGWDDIAIDDVEPDTDPVNDPVLVSNPVDPWKDLEIDEVEEGNPDIDLLVPNPKQDKTGRPVLPLVTPERTEEVVINGGPIPLDDIPAKTIDDGSTLTFTPPNRVQIDSVQVPERDEFLPASTKTTRINTPATDPTDNPDGDSPDEVVTVIDSLGNDYPGIDQPVLVNSIDSLDIGKKMILDKIEFARHSSHLNDRSKEVLTRLAEVLKKHPDYSILLEGHTEIDGAREANLDLSRRRAEACKKYLVKKRKIKSGRIEVKFYGPDQPITTEKEILWKNRRVEVTVF
ncbi:MAG: LamG-like jellyroll fold domain-containing protein [Bacteroidota bacterium]